MCCQNSIGVDKKSSLYQKRTSVLPIYGGIERAGYCLVVVAQLQCIGSSSYVDVLFLATAFFPFNFPFVILYLLGFLLCIVSNSIYLRDRSKKHFILNLPHPKGNK